MKLYLSGPMSGIADMNAPVFRATAAFLREHGHIVCSPVEMNEAMGFICDGNDGSSYRTHTWGDLLGRDVQEISNGKFDGIVLMKDWEKSRGARLELALALILGLKIFIINPKFALTSVPKCVAARLLAEELS